MQSKPKDIAEFSDSALMIVWDDGHESLYLHEDLRKSCPCARCNELRKSHQKGGPFKRTIPLGTKSTGIRPKQIEPVGLYAIRFVWDDGHDTGIYTFDFLRGLCTCEECQPSE